MLEVRHAKTGEIDVLKSIWKQCFGDPDNYIEFYYANRFREPETLLLLSDSEVLAMLTMIPVKVINPDNSSFNAAMLYAIATHPEKQNKGFASKLMEATHQFLAKNNNDLTILVPAQEKLFNFYQKQGYQNGFYFRELHMTGEMIADLPSPESNSVVFSPLKAEEYNQRRSSQLCGNLYVAYNQEEIDYQKKLSVMSGGDIFGIDIGDLQGCMIIERHSGEKAIIKEILITEEYLKPVIKLVSLQMQIKDCIIRTPAYLGNSLGGVVRPFAMFKQQNVDFDLIKGSGYLGIAFD